MSKVNIKQSGNGWCVASAGKLSGILEKTFVKDDMGLTSMEISFGSLAEGQTVPFNHRHKQNEEVYIVLGGKGVFTVDGTDVEVEAGDIVRMAPQVVRCNRNTGSEPFTYICVQAKDNSLEQYVMSDAEIVE